VLLVCCDQDWSFWWADDRVCGPIDRRLHHLSHCVAIPGFYPKAKALSGLGSNLELGKEGGLKVEITSSELRVGGHTDSAALAEQLDTFFTTVAALPALPPDMPETPENEAIVAGAVNAILAAAKAVADAGGVASTKLKTGRVSSV
jgi:hypothetical protein